METCGRTESAGLVIRQPAVAVNDEQAGGPGALPGIDLKPGADDCADRQVRRLAGGWGDALVARDASGLARQYCADVTFFDPTPPFSHTGADTYVRRLEAMLVHLPEGIGVERRDVEVSVSGDLAFMHCLARIFDRRTKEDTTCGWVRVTVVYRRHNGVWRIVHEHVSVPFHPQAVGLVNVTSPARALFHCSVRCWLDGTIAPRDHRISPVR